jgi:hypothetical protein
MTIINPLPNIFITNDENVSIKNILDNKNNINAIISLSDELSNKIYDIDEYDISLYNFSINYDSIDFNKINQTIHQLLKNNKNILIYEKNSSISFIIVIAFYISNIKFQFFQIAYILSKRMNINIEDIETSYLEQIFNFYQKNNKL